LDAVAFSHSDRNPDTGSHKALQIVRRGDQTRIDGGYLEKLSYARAATERIRTLSLCLKQNEVRDRKRRIRVERERDHRVHAVGLCADTDFDNGRAILSRTGADNIE
jgi:hypothetical protein